MYDCKIICDSLSPACVRLTTFQITFPRFILAEFNTHRMLSRNSASSRAIPVEKNIQRALENPFVPLAFQKNQRGMQGGSVVDFEVQEQAERDWLEGRDAAVKLSKAMLDSGVHKQWANRPLELYSWHTAIVTATEWGNFFGQRCSVLAQPEIDTIARMMLDAMVRSKPDRLEPGEWHLPLVRHVESDLSTHTAEQWTQISAARCARVSYLTHEGKRDLDADFELYGRLAAHGHMSPLEHPARANADRKFVGNFRGWTQLRKTILGEAVFRPEVSRCLDD